MHITVSSPGPLAGRIRIPGDLRLTLTLLSLGMYLDERISIIHSSCAPAVMDFRKFLERNGAEIDDSGEVFIIKGNRLTGTIVIDNDVPDSVLHIVTAGSVFSAQSIRILDGAKSKSHITEPLMDQLEFMGVSRDHITVDNDDVVIRDAGFSPEGIVPVRSPWAFEVVIAAVLAARNEVMISCQDGIVSPPEKVLAKLGFMLSFSGEQGEGQAELERRMAKASGEKPREMIHVRWNGNPSGVSFEVPGDSTLAAAVAGLAAVTQRSGIILEKVLWDRGRRGFFDALRRMKGKVISASVGDDQGTDSADITVEWSILDGVLISVEQSQTMTTELLILAAIASSAPGETVISDITDAPGVGREAFKLLARGLEKCGARVGDFTDGIVLKGGNELYGGIFEAGGRPDVALAFAVAGMTASHSATITGCTENMYPLGEFLRIVRILSGGGG